MTDLLGADSAYRTVTEACGLLDRSERGKLGLTGAEAKSFLQGQVTNDVERLIDGEGCYATFLTPKGKMLGDVRILDAGDELLLDTERGALQELFNMIRRYSLGYDVQLHKRTLECCLWSLIGPACDELVDGVPEGEHRHVLVDLDGVSTRAIRTDMGIDLLAPGDAAEPLRAALERREAVAIPESVAECLRIERGRPRYGVDIDDTVIPQEAGLNERAVSFTKGCYVGQETVARLHYRGKPNRHLRGVRLSGTASTGDALSLGDRSVGALGSVAESPRLGWIALALVRREAAPGSVVTVGQDGVTGEVVELPFEAALYDRPSG
jgi:folate-binding protein YgfZ